MADSSSMHLSGGAMLQAKAVQSLYCKLNGVVREQSAGKEIGVASWKRQRPASQSSPTTLPLPLFRLSGRHLANFFTSSLVSEIATRPPFTLSLSAGTMYAVEKKPKNPDERISASFTLPSGSTFALRTFPTW
jgi:hypothetical protein